jgi:stage III sporulation protein AA
MDSKDKVREIKNVLENEILCSLPPNIRKIINQLPDSYISGLEEIRIRLGGPLMICSGAWDFMVTSSGSIAGSTAEAYIVTREDCEKALQLLSNYSVYAIEEELRGGYITLKGGHRVGMVGRGIIESGKIKAIKNISGFNVRLARQVIGAADKILRYISRGGNDIYNTLIISPPQCGKTTLLRDIIRQLSTGTAMYGLKGMKVGLIDERSEIAGSFQGIPQNDVGLRTDILDACPKSSGIIMLIRSMSPKVVATDEIGSSADAEAIYEALNAGVRILTTIHGNSIEDILNRPFIGEVVRNRIFERLIILSSRLGPGTVEEITDGTNFKTIVDKPFK